MRKYGLFVFLALSLGLVSAACGGGSEAPTATQSPQAASPRSTRAPATPLPAVAPGQVQDVETVVLSIADAPVNFRQVPGAAYHLTIEDTCGLGSPDAEQKRDCLRRLNEWGRSDTFQVMFRDENPLAVLSGVFEVLNIASVYRDGQGVTQAFAWGKEQLLARIDQERDASLVSIPKVGDESLAFVVNATQAIGGREVPLSFYTVDFRRRNVLVRVATVAPRALAKIDDALTLARLLDERILKGGEEPPFRRTTPASVRPTPRS